MLFHERVQFDHGEGAVLWFVAELLSGLALFKDALEDHAIERAMANGLSSRAVADEDDFAKLRPLPRFAAMVSTTDQR